MAYFVVIRERGDAWDWARPMRRQAKWDAHAAFMDALSEEGFILAGGPLGSEDEALRVLHVIEAADARAVEARLDDDPWTPTGMLKTVSIEPWTILLGKERVTRK
jgi:uncharacterized protein YciI